MILKIEDLVVTFLLPRKGFFGHRPTVDAVHHMGLHVKEGEIVGLVGESGSGKSTLANAVLKTVPIAGGRIFFKERDISKFNHKELDQYRQDVQMIFQDPLSSLDPRMTVEEILMEPLLLHHKHLKRRERKQKILDIACKVGLSQNSLVRYPHEFSGGQAQRIAIARAVINAPKLLVCDEATSALDVSVQAQVLHLLLELRESLGLSILFISHNLAVVSRIANRIAVMYLGAPMESGPTEYIEEHPAHPYSKVLWESTPALTTNFRFHALPGEIPSPANPPKGCRFHTRCPIAQPQCSEHIPRSVKLGKDRESYCLFAKEL